MNPYFALEFFGYMILLGLTITGFFYLVMAYTTVMRRIVLTLISVLSILSVVLNITIRYGF